MNVVRMYLTSSCPYCHRANALLQQRGVSDIDEIRIDLEPAERARMIEETEIGRASCRERV